MMEQVEKLGLVLDQTHVEDGIHPNYAAPFDNTPEPPFNVGGPNLREVTGDFYHLHESVKKRWKYCENYRPDNLMKFQEELDAWHPVLSSP